MFLFSEFVTAWNLPRLAKDPPVSASMNSRSSYLYFSNVEVTSVHCGSGSVVGTRGCACWASARSTKPPTKTPDACRNRHGHCVYILPLFCFIVGCVGIRGLMPFSSPPPQGSGFWLPSRLLASVSALPGSGVHWLGPADGQPALLALLWAWWSEFSTSGPQWHPGGLRLGGPPCGV